MNKLCYDGLKPGIMIRISFHKPRNTLSFYYICCSCFCHPRRNALEEFKLGLLDFEGEIIVVYNRKAAHKEVCISHNACDSIREHGFETLKTECLNFFWVFRCQHLTIIVQKPLRNRYLYSSSCFLSPIKELSIHRTVIKIINRPLNKIPNLVSFHINLFPRHRNIHCRIGIYLTCEILHLSLRLRWRERVLMSLRHLGSSLAFVFLFFLLQGIFEWVVYFCEGLTCAWDSVGWIAHVLVVRSRLHLVSIRVSHESFLRYFLSLFRHCVSSFRERSNDIDNLRFDKSSHIRLLAQT